MPWFCATEIGCNLDVEPHLLVLMRKNSAAFTLRQKGTDWYLLSIRDANTRIAVNLGYDNGRWKQVGPAEPQKPLFTIRGSAYFL
jgi:hypothetical protein